MVTLSWSGKLFPSAGQPSIIEAKKQLFEDAGAIYLNAKRYSESGQRHEDASLLAEESVHEDDVQRGENFVASLNKATKRAFTLSRFDPESNVGAIHPADIRAFRKAFEEYTDVLNDVVVAPHKGLPKHIRDIGMEYTLEPDFYKAKELIHALEQTQDIPQHPLYKVIDSLRVFCDHADQYNAVLRDTDTIDLPGR